MTDPFLASIEMLSNPVFFVRASPESDDTRSKDITGQNEMSLSKKLKIVSIESTSKPFYSVTKLNVRSF